MSSAGIARRPRAFVKLNGKQTKLLAFRTLSNSHFQCDTFSFELQSWNQSDGFGLDFWGGDSNGVMSEILLGFLDDGDDVDAVPSQLDSLLIGEVDDVDVDPLTGMVSVSGRDLTGRLIDNKVSENWPDRTASEIVTDLAGKAGLNPKVTATKIPVGKYAKDQYNALSRDVPMWDLITSLADQEGFDAYVKGTTLYFGPSQVDDGEPITFTLRDGDLIEANVEDLKLHRSLTLAKDITVTVISYHPGKKVPVKAVAKRQGSARSASTSFRTGKTAQNYVIRKPGLTQQRAQDLAQKTLTDLTRHERTFSARLVADTTTQSRGKATISGTNSGWDTDYFVDTVTREYEGDDLAMTITAKNHQIESQAA